MLNTAQQGFQSRDAEAQQHQFTPQAVRRELWLDLEDTVVTPITQGWHIFSIINLEKIQEVVASFAPHTINIFSFAIWDKTQLQLFDTHCRSHLETALGTPFSTVMTVDGIGRLCCNQLMLSPDRVDFQEMSNFWGKQGAFRLFMRARAEDFAQANDVDRLHALPLDDMVFSQPPQAEAWGLKE